VVAGGMAAVGRAVAGEVVALDGAVVGARAPFAVPPCPAKPSISNTCDKADIVAHAGAGLVFFPMFVTAVGES